MNWTVPYLDLKQQYLNQEPDFLDAFKRIMSTGSFILRSDVQEFEDNIKTFLGVKHVIGVNSGTDALNLAVQASSIQCGDEVITVSHTFVATLASIHHKGATPVLIDILDDYNMDASLIEQAITPKTKAIMPVHLNGRCCNMDIILDLAKRHNLIVIEDTAQALGAKYKGRSAGTFGDMGCFSAHPMKILGCAGDGGFVVTNDDQLAEKLYLLRNHGQKTKQEISFYGFCSRLDTLQAALLNIKFQKLPEWIERRREIARTYNEAFRELDIVCPNYDDQSGADYFDVFSSYVIRTPHQTELMDFLRENQIEAFVHMGPHTLADQEGLANKEMALDRTRSLTQQILSLPVYPEMTAEQVNYVIEKIRDFHGKA